MTGLLPLPDRLISLVALLQQQHRASQLAPEERLPTDQQLG
jgi:hypothetical protein